MPYPHITWNLGLNLVYLLISGHYCSTEQSLTYIQDETKGTS
jgi:hypothetical protein